MTMSDHPRLVSIQTALNLVAANRPDLEGERGPDFRAFWIVVNEELLRAHAECLCLWLGK